MTIQGAYIECQASETVVYIAPYCSKETPLPTTFVAATAGRYQLGQLVIPCTTSTAINYYSPTIVIVNNIQITLTVGDVTGDLSPTSHPTSCPSASPSCNWDDSDSDDEDLDWTCSGAIDIDQIAEEEDPIIAAIEYDLQMNLTADQIGEVEDAFYYATTDNTTNTTTVDLSFLLDGYTWTQTFTDYEDPLDPFDNCSMPYTIGTDYPDYYNFGNETETDPDIWDVSAFVFANDTSDSTTNSSMRLMIRQSSNLLTSNSRLYNPALWMANDMDTFMTELLTKYPALKTPSEYGFIADLLEAVGLGNSATGFQKCDISTCDQIEWKDAWTDEQKKVYYIFYAIRTRMLWLKTINENLNVVQTNLQGNIQVWIDKWWPSDIDKRGAIIGPDIAGYLWKGVAQLTGLIPYVGKVVKFGVEGLGMLDAKRRDALRLKMRGASWAEFGASFTGTGGLIDTFRNGLTASAEGLNGDPTVEDLGAFNTLKGGNYFGQPTVSRLVKSTNLALQRSELAQYI